ncbi:MAG: tetratricopeptide repeat protein [Planctomycetaceae bacterium]|nr:tetratricopeptide repeat protein [Planctomycetaceae bacterium]
MCIFSSCNSYKPQPDDSQVDDPVEESGAESQIDDYVKKIPSFADEYKKASDAFDKSDIAGAKNIFADLYKQYPELPPPGIFLLQFFIQSKNGNNIKPILEMTTNETPNDPEAYILLADVALQQQELTAAELLLLEAESKLTKYSVNTTRKKSMTSSLLRSQSLLAEVRGRWKDYEELATKRIKHDGESAILLRQKGIALFQQNKEAEAEKIFQLADKIKTKKTKQNTEQGLPAEAMLSRLYATRGNNEKSKKLLNDALEKYPNSKEVILLSIQSRLDENKPEEAKILADKLAANFPEFEAATKIKATIALYLNDFTTAEKLFQDLIILAPSDHQAKNGLALALCEQNDPKKLKRALEYANDNVNKNQQNSEYWSTLGWILLNTKQIDAAKQALQQSINTSNGSITPATAYYLAQLEKQTGNKNQAKQLLEKALQNQTPFAKRRDAQKLLNEL